MLYIRPDQIRSVAQLCLTLCDPMNRMPPAALVGTGKKVLPG